MAEGTASKGTRDFGSATEWVPPPLPREPGRGRPGGRAEPKYYRTYEGLRLLRFGTKGAITACVLGVLGSLLIVGAISSLGAPAIGNAQGLANALLALFVSAIFLFVALFVAGASGLLGILGMGRMVSGAVAFDERHRRAVGISTVFATIAALVYIFSEAWEWTSTVGAASLIKSSDGASIGAAAVAVADLAVTSAVLSLVAGALAAGAMIKVIVELLPKSNAPSARMFLALSLTGPALQLLAALAIQNSVTHPPALQTEVTMAYATLNAISYVAIGTVVASVFSLVALAQYLRMLAAAEARARRIDRAGPSEASAPTPA